METQTETLNSSIYEVDSNTRVVAYHTGQYSSTSDYASLLGVALDTVQSARGMAHFGSNTELSNAIQLLVSDSVYYGDFANTKKQIGDYLNSKGVPHLFHELKGYSQGEWNEVVVYGESGSMALGDLEFLINSVDTYYKGEVYLVNVERAKVYTADDGSTITKWEQDEDYAYTEVVQEFFKLDKDYVLNNFGL
jgi:hypothetical protein